MDAEEIKDDLDPLYEAAMKQQHDIATGIEVLTKCAKDFVATHYAGEINHLSAEGYRALTNAISRHTTNLSLEISNVLYRHREE